MLDTAAVTNTALHPNSGDHASDEVEKFLRFLDTASPDDFDPD